MTEITRRELAAAAGIILFAGAGAGQTESGVPANTDWYRQARESKQAAAAELAAFPMAMSVEPAFRFEA